MLHAEYDTFSRFPKASIQKGFNYRPQWPPPPPQPRLIHFLISIGRLEAHLKRYAITITRVKKQLNAFKCCILCVYTKRVSLRDIGLVVGFSLSFPSL